MENFLPDLYREIDNSDELPKIAEHLTENGGSIVAYRQTYSFVLVTVSRTVYERVPQGDSAVWVGAKHAILSLLFGPWSWLGPFLTLQSLLQNLSGGIDVTHELGFRPDGNFMPLETLKSNARQKEKALQYGFATILLVVLGVLIWKVVIPVFDPTVWSRGFLLQLSITVILAIIIGTVISRFRR